MGDRQREETGRQRRGSGESERQTERGDRQTEKGAVSYTHLTLPTRR